MRIDFTGDPALDWSNLISYALEASAGENPNNGLDDDNDGVVDEQLLVRMEDLNGNGVINAGDSASRVVLADRVTALTFTRVAGEFQITLQASVSRSITRDLQLMNRSVTATVALQNKG